VAIRLLPPLGPAPSQQVLFMQSLCCEDSASMTGLLCIVRVVGGNEMCLRIFAELQGATGRKMAYPNELRLVREIQGSLEIQASR